MCFVAVTFLTLTDRRTDCANTSTAIPRLKKGCWVMSYIFARNPPFSANAREGISVLKEQKIGAFQHELILWL